MAMGYVLLAFVLWEAKQLVVRFVGSRPGRATWTSRLLSRRCGCRRADREEEKNCWEDGNDKGDDSLSVGEREHGPKGLRVATHCENCAEGEASVPPSESAFW